MANVAATVNVANGNMVMISTSNEMYNGCAWTVIDAAPRDKPGRIIVASDDVQDDDGEPKKIAIRREAVRAAFTLYDDGARTRRTHETIEPAMAPCAGPTPPQNDLALAEAVDNFHNFDGDEGFEHLLNIWWPLPLLGGGSLMLRRAAQPTNLVFYPNIQKNGLEMWFHSCWAREVVKVDDWDIMKVCPMQHYWPYCHSCFKFHCPPSGSQCHRNTQKHKKAIAWLNYLGLEGARAYAGVARF